LTNAPLSVHPYRIRLPLYEGPLDVLVELVRRGELSALDLALSDIVVGYLENLRLSAGYDLEEVGEFLVLVAALLEIKSRLLLPDAKPSKSDERQAPTVSTKQQLVRHVAELKRVEEAAAFLADRARERRKLLRRLVDDLTPEGGDQGGSLRELEVWDLVAAFSRLVGRGLDAQAVVRDATPITVYQDRLEARVLQSGRVGFADLFADDQTRAQRIGKFIALLELIKSLRVWIEWDAKLGDLVVMPPRPAAATPSSRPMQPLPSPLLIVTSEGLAAAAEAEEVVSWPDLPQVPELPKRRNPWDGYAPIRRIDEPPQQFASP
jgi:segregation and condensation protein A